MTKIILTEEQSITTALDTVWLDAIKSELQKTVDFSKNLKITDIEDKKQFQVIKDTKNGYVKTRNSLERAFKSKRDFYNKASKDNLEAQREAVWVITEEENRLAEIVNIANLQKLRKDNEKKLQDRKDALKKCEYETTDDILLDMKEKDFEDLLNEKRLEFNAKKEAELKEREEKLAREKELEEAKKQARLQAQQEAEEKARLEKQRVEQEKIESERKQKEEIERIKQEQLDKENAEKARIEKEQQEAEENKAKLEKEKKYTTYRDSIEHDKTETVDWKVIFYKKVWEFIL